MSVVSVYTVLMTTAEVLTGDLTVEVVSPPLTSGEVAAKFHVDPKTVNRWAKAGKIAAFRTPGGHLRFPSDVVARHLELTPPVVEKTKRVRTVPVQRGR